MAFRGEFKTPSGKLIAIEFDVVGGILRNVVVTGDFFLYPEEALGSLSGALEGASSGLDEAAYAALVRAALGQDVELLGSSPEALAVAVVRAVGDSSRRDTSHDG